MSAANSTLDPRPTPWKPRITITVEDGVRTRTFSSLVTYQQITVGSKHPHQPRGEMFIARVIGPGAKPPATDLNGEPQRIRTSRTALHAWLAAMADHWAVFSGKDDNAP